MTHNFKTGDKVKIIVETLSFSAFRAVSHPSYPPKKGDTLEVVRVENGDLIVAFEGAKRSDGTQHTQYIERSDVEPLKIEPVKPTAPMTKAVLKLLEAKGSLTALEAGGVLKCRMLPYQINRLRNLGWRIQTELKNDPIDGQRYARYHLLDSIAA